jgi:hypothetical protein
MAGRYRRFICNPYPSMNPFEDLCTDEVHIQRPDGTACSPFKCAISDDTVAVFDERLVITTADKLVRALPNGKTERYDILDVTFNSCFHDIPANFELKVRRQHSIVSLPKTSVTNINITHSHGFQIGDHNIQSIVNSFKQVLRAIDESDASSESKVEAKSRLKAFLEHPLTAALLGGVAGGLF